MLIIITLLANFLGWLGVKTYTSKFEKSSHLRTWTQYKSNPVVDGLLKKHIPEITDTKTRVLADRVKAFVRSAVQTEAFGLCVDAAFANQGKIRDVSESLSEKLNLRQNPSTFSHLPDNAITIR